MSVNLSFIGGAGWQFFDNSGNLLSGGKIYTYAAGTTTPLTTYTDRTGATPNSNPIILDSAGRTPQQIWSTEGVLYKYVVTTAADVVLRTWDNIGGTVVASNLAADLASNTSGNGLDLVGEPTIAQMIASTAPARGVGATWHAGGFLFTEAAAGAADQDITTAGGVKLYYATVGYGQDRTLYRTGGGAVRQTTSAGGWSFINDASHAPYGWSASTPVALTGTNLRVTYDFTAAEVGTFSVTVDESYAALGLMVGASVGTNVTDIAGFAPISGRIVAGTSGILFSSTSGNVISQVVDQAAGTITVTHLAQTHTDSGGSAVMVTPSSASNSGDFAITTQTKTGFTLQYVRPLSCRITCTTATPGSEVFTVSQTENTGLSATWVGPNILRVTHPAVGNNFPSAIVNLWRTSAASYQFKVDGGSTSTDIYFLNADGTAVTAASTNMIIAFSMPGKFPAAIPSGSSLLGSVQRDMVPVDFNLLSGPSSNLWLSFSHPT